jgi:hypothetical protein
MSCEIEEYPQLIKKQQETWDSIETPGVSTVYYYSSYKTTLTGNRLDIDIPEGPGYFYNKTMIAFEKMLMDPWDYIFKTDNSAYVNKAELINVVENKPREKYYGGHLYETTYVKSDPFLWGEGMFFSRDVVQYLVREYKSSTIGRSGVEDVHIGMILNEEFPWDTSLTIPKYSQLPVPVSHVYRCKNDQTNNTRDTLSAMESIHQFLHPELAEQPM